MATVTGLTAEKMLELADENIVGAALVGFDLVLTRRDGSTINLGSVRGATGPTGPQGQVSTTQLTNAIDTLNATIATKPQGLVVPPVQVSTDQTLAGFSANIFQDIPGAAVTFEPTIGRYYQVTAQAAFHTNEANVTFDFEVFRVGAAPVAADTAYAKTADKTVLANATRTFLVPGTWVGDQTLKLRVRSDNSLAKHVRGDSYVTSLTISDVGEP